MKRSIYIFTAICLLFCSIQGIAQPFELDPKIKPLELGLKPDGSSEGALGIATIAEVNENPAYFFISGHDVFQPIDIYIFSITTGEQFTVHLVKDSWKDLIEKKTSSESNNGIINLQLRAWGAFGFKIMPISKTAAYSILVKAGSPVKEYLGSPFVKATDDNTSSVSSNKNDSQSENSENLSEEKEQDSLPVILYIVIGVLLLAVGLLAGKLLGKGKVASVILVVLFYNPITSFTPIVVEDTMTLEEARMGGMERNIRRFYNASDNRGVIDLALDKALDKLKESIDGLDTTIDNGKAMIDFAKSHKGFSDCINSAPLPGAPRIPSFCTTSECSSCFRDARQKFNDTRYQFEKLSAIYKCTIEYSKKAIALGDNTSGIHAVSGMAWQVQRTKITKSVDDLKKAYDNKYDILLNGLQESMQKLSACEASHGLEDWFDRFGYVYYEFIRDKYRRDE